MKASKERRLPQTSECLNCHTHIEGQNYCPNCGQKNVVKDAPLRDFIHDALGDFLTFDSKFFRSFGPLLLKPGFLTKQYITGKRVDYILPLRLYFFVSLIFFFIYSLSDSNVNIKNSSGRNYVTIDSLRDNLMTHTEITSEESYKIMLDISEHIDEIRPNSTGNAWRTFFETELFFNDTLATRLTNLLYIPYDIEADTNQLDLPKLYSELSAKIIQSGLLTDSMTHVMINRLKSKYLVKNQVFHSNVKNEFVIDSIIQVHIKNPTVAENISQNILTRFRFSRLTDIYNIDYLVPNTSASDGRKLGNKIGYSLSSQVSNINRNPQSKALIKNQMVNDLPKVIFILMPLFALILKVLFYSSKSNYINHLIFALHSHSVMFIFFLLTFLVDHEIFKGLCVLAVWVHIYFSMVNVYNTSYLKAFIKFLILFFTYMIISLIAFAGVLLYIVYTF